MAPFPSAMLAYKSKTPVKNE